MQPHSEHPDAPNKRCPPSQRAEVRNRALEGTSAKNLGTLGQIGTQQSWAKDATRLRRDMNSAYKIMFPCGCGPEGLADFDHSIGERFIRTTPNLSHFSVATEFMLDALATLIKKQEDNYEWEPYVHTDSTYNICSEMYITTSAMFSTRAMVSKMVYVTYSR
jgi:hypothetical protein